MTGGGLGAADVLVLDEVDSTQDEVHRLAGQGAAHGTTVLAARQSAGRGSRGRSWASPEGGLWLSVLWRPRAGAGDTSGVPLLSLRAGLAVAAVVEGLGPGVAVQLKWPNDVLIHDRKVGGILCEARLYGATGWVALGVGLNVRNPLPDDARFPAARLAEWHPSLNLSQLAAGIARDLACLGASAALATTELAEWRARDWLRGRQVSAPVPGRAVGISPAGHLLVAPDAGGPEQAVVAGDGFAL